MTSNPGLRMPLCRNVVIEEASIPQLQNHLATGRFTTRDLTECYLERIKQINPYTRSVIEINPDALEIGDACDKERAAGIVRGPLHGIPFLVKDNMATKDKMQTTAGSSVLIGTVVPEDAHIVSLLRAAGAVLLGHANLSEWASMRATYYSEGYSSRGGQCRNPYNLAESPGGSSCGSAGAVACNMCAFSVGTETDGSVIFPADRNGVVGLKPTVGLTSRHGIIPESESLDTVGTFGRTVEDAAMALDVIVGIDSRDKYTVSQQSPSGRSYSSWVSGRDDLRGAKFGLPLNRVWEAASAKNEYKLEYNILTTIIDRIREAGAEVFDGTDFPSAEEVISPNGWDWDYGNRIGHPEQSEFTVVKIEFYNNLRAYLSLLINNKNNIHGLEDVMAYNRMYTEEEGGVPGTHPAWVTGQDSFEMSKATKGVKTETYYKALNYIRRKSREEGIDAALQFQQLELNGLLVPIHADGGVACQLAAKAGYPMISIPIGIDDRGVPFGLGIIQSAWKEHLLIKFGSAIEDLIRGRKAPEFLNIDAKNYMYVGVSPQDKVQNARDTRV